MKKLFTLLTMLVVGIGSSWGEDGTVVATMSDLVTGASFNNAKTVKENSIYSFSYSTYIGGINNTAVANAFEGSKYVTVAMWVWGNSGSGCLFGYGDQGDGIKFQMSAASSNDNAGISLTTKNKTDIAAVKSANIAANQWNLVAFAIAARSNTGNNVRYYITATDDQFWTKTRGDVYQPAEGSRKCAIGSGNQGNAREAFTGLIANVTVIESDALLNNSRIAALVGAAPSSSVWYKPAFGGRTWTWNTSTSKYDASDGTTSTDKPARADGKGPVYRFNSVGTTTATGNVNTSDYGGAWVIGTRDNPSKVTVGIGSWAGSIEVETYQTANITYSIDLKSTEPDGFATVWTDGTLNFPNRSSCSIDDGNNQRWYIGENGIITTNFTSVNKGDRQWNFQIVVANDPMVGETDTRIIHVRKRKVMTWGANISSNINGVTVFQKADDGTLTEKNTTNDANFEVTYDNTGMYVTYTCKGYFNTNDPNYTYTYSGGAGTSGSRVSINHNGGSVKLSGAYKTYYLTGSNSATQTTVNFNGTNVNYDNELGIGKAIYNINNTKITTPKFITSQGQNNRSAVVNLTGNSVITVTGNTNLDGNTSSIMIGHWNGSSDLTLSGTAQIVAEDAQFLVGLTRNNQTITLNENSSITAKGIKVSSGASGTNTLNLNGGSLNLGDVGITAYGNSMAVNVNGNTTITATDYLLLISQPITVASGKTLTIDGGESNAIVRLTGSVTNNGTIKFKNVAIEGGEARDCSTLSLPYTYENCTLVINETSVDFAEDDETITITRIPSGFTSVRLRRVDRKYITLDVDNGTATFTDTEAKVSGPKCLYDFTFSKETLAERKIENTSVILNSGSRGSSHGLNYDTNFNSGNSYNEETGLLKAKSTPWRDMSGGNAWPINYSVAVYANVPDIENGCLMAFGSSTKGGNKYLALIRGASSNEIKLVKGDGTNNAFEVIATMSAENATVAKHLVVFTKNGSTFKVYCDGVNVATTTYDQTLGTGFQIGSVHGGVGESGIIRISDNSVSSDVRDAVEIQSIRIFEGVLTDDQMTALMEEFPYVSNGGSYSRIISADANLGEDGAWTTGETTAHIPTPVVEDASTYYPDVTLTTSANATLTVNENATFGKTTFEGSGTLTIAANEGHSLNIGGAVLIYSNVVVKFGAMDMSTSPVTIGESGSVEFDFSASNFSGVTTSTDYPITGNTSDYGNKVTGVYPSDQTHTYTLAHNGTSNNYILTVAPTVAFFQQRAINLVKPYYDGNYVGVGAGKYTISLGETSYAEMAGFRTAVMSWASLEDCIDPTIIINQPTSAFYRIKSGDKYLQDARKSDSATQRTLTDAAGANSAETIFYLDNNKFIGYKTGYGFGFSVCQTQDTEQLNTQLFTESAEMGKYTIQSQQGTCTSADNNVGYWGVSGSELSRVDDAASGACWTLEEVTSLPLTLAANSYTSFSAPVPVTIPEGEDPAFYAYIATSSGDGVINMQKVTGDVAANTGLIISTYGREANPSFDIAADGDTPSGNMLKPNWAASKVSVDNYFFAKVNGKYMFTKVTGDGTNYTLPGHKAYLQISGETARIAINWGDDNPTGIEGLQNESVELKDGKYYQNGKVVVVRNGVKYNVAGQIIK